MHPSVREALLFHLLFFVAAAAALWLAPAALYGRMLLAAAIVYQLALPAWALVRGHGDWLSLWAFLLPLSLCQPLADWALVEVAHTLVFPHHGVWRIGGAVPLYFAGMWTMALFPIVLLAQRSRWPWLSCAVLSLAVFAVCEALARPLGLWHAQHVATIAGVAVYVLAAEVMLGWATLAAWRGSRSAGLPGRVLAAVAVSIFYTGALFWCLLLVDPLFSKG
jgi:hypothetical protein